MYKQVLQSIAGIDLYPIISLMIFFVFFIGILIWIFTMNKSYVSRMSHLPLDNSNDNSQEVHK